MLSGRPCPLWRSDCTRWPLPGLCSLTGLEACPVAALLLFLSPFLLRSQIRFHAWTKSRQEQAEADVRRAWDEGVAFGEGTYEVRERSSLVHQQTQKR